MYRKINNNLAVRQALKEYGVLMYELANYLDVSEPTLTRWMRGELPKDKQDKIVALIKAKAEMR